MERNVDTSTRKVALVTGASSGIGEAVARRFSRAGMNCILAARSYDRLVQLAKEFESFNAGGSFLPVKMDVTDADAVHDGVERGLDAFGRIDVLVSNAGVGRLDWLEFLDPRDDILHVLDVNLVGSILAARAVLPPMIRQRSGHVILMASMAGFVATPTYSIYAASKFGVRGFAEALRREVSIWGIHVSGVYPGAVDTSFAEEDVQRRRTGMTSPDWMVLSTETVAEAVYGLLRRPRRALVLPGYMRLIILLNRACPGLLDAVTRRFFVEREREQAARPPGDSPTGGRRL